MYRTRFGQNLDGQILYQLQMQDVHLLVYTTLCWSWGYRRIGVVLIEIDKSQNFIWSHGCRSQAHPNREALAKEGEVLARLTRWPRDKDSVRFEAIRQNNSCMLD